MIPCSDTRQSFTDALVDQLTFAANLDEGDQ